jgi:hypothetical protein
MKCNSAGTYFEQESSSTSSSIAGILVAFETLLIKSILRL